VALPAEADVRHDRPVSLPMDDADRQSDLSVADVLGRLGAGLLTVAAVAGGGLDRRARGVTIYDAAVPVAAEAENILLAVGVDPDTPEAVQMLHTAADWGCSAVVVRAADRLPVALLDAARTHEIVLLRASVDVPWVHLAAMLRVGIGPRRRQDVAGIALGDLFAFANVLADDVGGAVTIEDPHSRVLAYSSVDGDVDEPRKETILGRQVPRRYMRMLEKRGVLRQLLASDDVVHLDALPDLGLRARLAISVRAAGELLGFIWVAESGQPLASDAERLLREAAQIAALHLIRDRLDQLHASTVTRTLVRELLDGSPAPDVAAARLGLAHDAPYTVVAFEASGQSVAPGRLLQVIDVYCSTFRRGTLTVDMGPRIYAVLPVPVDDPDLRRFVGDGARRAQEAVRTRVLAAVGPRVASIDRVGESRSVCDRVMRVLLRGHRDVVVAGIDDVRADSALLEILDVVRERAHLREGRVALLAADASARHSALLETLRAYLDHFGDITSAAQHLQIHPNTFRYRLRRVVTLTGIDLDDPSERLLASLQLRLLG
jgi:hypothetical protein